VSDDKRPMSAELVDLALDRWAFCLHDGDVFALPVLDGEPAIAVPLRGTRGVRSLLARHYRDLHGRPPSAASLADALVVLEGEAEPYPRPVGLRVAAHPDGSRWLDLGTPSGEVVKIADGCWSVTTTNRVVFRRTNLTGEVPAPVPGGDLSRLRELVNIADADWPLLVAFLVAMLDAEMPHPIAAVTGEQGTGKSTTVRRLVQLVDPSPAPLRTCPRDVEQWAVAASGSWLVALDNVSSMRDWLSDALCRAATGDGMVRRRLYSDSDVSVLAFRRVVLLTYIDAGALRGDLADRLVTFELGRIDPTRRQPDADLDAAWTELRPHLLGGLLDLAAQVYEVLPDVRLTRLSRMADFHRLVAAVDTVTGWSGTDRYATQGERLAEDVVAGDPVAEQINIMMSPPKREGPTPAAPAPSTTVWSGTASDLLAAIEAQVADRKLPRTWPTSARAMAGALKRCAPALRTVGIEVDGPHRVGSDRDRTWTLTRIEEHPDQPSGPSAPSATDATDGPDGAPHPTSTASADATDGADGPRAVPLPDRPPWRCPTCARRWSSPPCLAADCREEGAA
jgi:hypothetical protein